MNTTCLSARSDSGLQLAHKRLESAINDANTLVVTLRERLKPVLLERPAAATDAFLEHGNQEANAPHSFAITELERHYTVMQHHIATLNALLHDIDI